MRKFFASFLLLVAQSLMAQSGEVLLHPGDKVHISVGAVLDSELAQIKGVYTISDEGTVNLLHIGEVRASGLKPSKLQRVIEQAYIDQEIYTRPNVLVTIDGPDATSRQIYVTGVQKPGAIPFRQDMTLSQAVQFAGGPTAFTSLRHVRLIRANKTTEHNLAKNMGDPKVDVVLQPNDQIHLTE